jgi:SNF2 family DNA or RNA helicase
VPAASRLLVPWPRGAIARSVSAGSSLPAPARALAGVGLVGGGAAELTPLGVEVASARSLSELEPCEDTTVQGSVCLVGLLDGDEAPFGPGPGDGAAGADPLTRPERPPVEVSLAKRLAALLQPPPELLLAADGPLTWPGPLLPYQLAAIRELLARDMLLLADDMGLGKTVEALAALRILALRHQIEAALVVAPAGLLTQWRAEVHRWAPELRLSTVHGGPADRRWQWRTPAHVYLTSYETLRADFTGNPHSPVARPWDLVVLDEAQKIKNAATDVSRACKRLRRRRQWALTGTPLENAPADLISLLEFVNPAPPRAHRFALPPLALREELRCVQLRRRKADVLHELPPKRVSRLLLPLTPAQRISYERAEREGVVELRARGASVQVQHVLALIVRLKQICNFCPTSGASSKLDDLRERVGVLADEGYKALVFTQFANAENGARAIAGRLGSTALAYTGDLAPHQRDHVLHQFRTQPERRVLVLSLLAGGQGLNLQEASYVFPFDRWWNPAVEQQAEARSHRLGQADPVTVYTYVCENTIEERIERVLEGKRLLFDELVDDVSLDLAATLTSEELFDLFDLDPPPTGAARV